MRCSSEAVCIPQESCCSQLPLLHPGGERGAAASLSLPQSAPNAAGCAPGAGGLAGAAGGESAITATNGGVFFYYFSSFYFIFFSFSHPKPESNFIPGSSLPQLAM